MRIGLVPQGGRDWIAGTIHLQNIVRAVSLLPPDERPSLYFILGPDHEIDEYRDLGAWLPSLKRYSFRSGRSLKFKIVTTLRQRQFKQWPTSFERLVRRLHLSAVFPVHASLGADFPCAWVGWIPDFQHKRLPHYFSQAELRARDLQFDRIVREATRVVVSSQDAYQDLMRWFPTDPEKVGVLPFVSVASPAWYEGDPRAVVNDHGLPGKYLMFPSQFWKHKNHRCLFEAIRLLKEGLCPDIALVCTGRMHDHRHPLYADELAAEIRRCGIEGQVHCLGLLQRGTQIQLLRAAAAVVQPSIFEGWSSLVEDARTLGKRIYVSEIPIHREQEPADAQFFNPESPQELATLIAKDWSRLTPGPDGVQEQEAFRAQGTRATTFARLFLEIIRKASVAC